MVVVARNPRAYSLPTVTGKSVDHIAWYDQGRGPVPGKETLDIVCDDDTVYRWTRFGESEPWTFEFRVRADGSRDDVTRHLPKQVAELVARSDDVLYR